MSFRSLALHRSVAAAMALTLIAGAACAQEKTPARPAPAAAWPTVFNSAELARWIKPKDADLRKRLTPLQYEVTQEEATETPFRNTYWDNHAAGIYVDVVSGEPLFSSLDKYESGTGWPSFTKPLVPANIVTKTDRLLGYERTEVRSKHADSHLGHVFDDGPKPAGLRYCMNSAAMRFIPAADLAKMGYGEYSKLFAGKKP